VNLRDLQGNFEAITLWGDARYWLARDALLPTRERRLR
jgi:hypothetical protein